MNQIFDIEISQKTKKNMNHILKVEYKFMLEMCLASEPCLSEGRGSFWECSAMRL